MSSWGYGAEALRAMHDWRFGSLTLLVDREAYSNKMSGRPVPSHQMFRWMTLRGM